MIANLLSDEEKRILFDFCTLLALSDNPLRWDGKLQSELTSITNLDDMTIEVNKSEAELIEEMIGFSEGYVYPSVEDQLLHFLKRIPVTKVEFPEERGKAARAVLFQMLSGENMEDDEGYIWTKDCGEVIKKRPEISKIMLFEMFLVALRDGCVSDVEEDVLKAFQQWNQLDDFLYDELFERAKALNFEVSKIVSIVLE